MNGKSCFYSLLLAQRGSWDVFCGCGKTGYLLTMWWYSDMQQPAYFLMLFPIENLQQHGHAARDNVKNYVFSGSFAFSLSPSLPLWSRRQEAEMFRLTLQRLLLDVWYPNKHSHWTTEIFLQESYHGQWYAPLPNKNYWGSRDQK